MVDDIASDSESTSTSNDSKASDKCKSPLVVPGNAAARMLQIFEKAFDKFDALVDPMIQDEERWKIC